MQSELDSERARRQDLQAELAGLQQRLQAEIAERQRIAAEMEQREIQRAQEDAVQLRRLQAAIDAVVAREDEQTDRLLAAARRVALIDDHLATLAGLLSKQGRRLLAPAQEELLRLREDLAGGSPARPPQPDRARTGTAPADGASVAGHHHSAAPSPGLTPANTTIVPYGRTAAVDTGAAWQADIIICVHNALDDVRRCLDSVTRHTGAQHRLILVDDGSDAPCAAFLADFARVQPQVTLLRNERPSGYTRAANQGLRESTADVVVLLNSDTIVTPRWLERLAECLHSDPAIGIAGPLSNAASYQSVPECYDRTGDWALNPLPPGWDADRVAAAVASLSSRAYPRVPFVNGFCFAIRRAVLDTVGLFDEQRFPNGYGEENDYCLRAAAAGFDLAIADDAYVYHAKSRSYSHQQRRALGKSGRAALLAKYGRKRVAAHEAIFRVEPTLASLRRSLGDLLNAAEPSREMPSVLFLLPVSGGGGGAHSVVQEAAGLRRLGLDAQVAVRATHLPRYRDDYAGLGDTAAIFFGYGTPEELREKASRFDVVVATIHTSVPLLAEMALQHPHMVPAYYIQDYEPFFYARNSPGWKAAARSYTLIPGATLFAKTRWLCDTVRERHGVAVHQVSPSLDHAVYFPPASRRTVSPVRVAAMIRPGSPRRAAGRTMAVLRKLAREFPQGVEIHILGCTDASIEDAGLAADFPFTNHGILSREQVANVLRQSDVFLDLSDYQAFGRTGLEAMACGCAVVLPARGGASEYAAHGENALVVETRRQTDCYQAARELVMDETLRKRLQDAAIATAARFSIDLAARSERELFRSAWLARTGSSCAAGAITHPSDLPNPGPDGTIGSGLIAGPAANGHLAKGQADTRLPARDLTTAV